MYIFAIGNFDGFIWCALFMMVHFSSLFQKGVCNDFTKEKPSPYLWGTNHYRGHADPKTVTICNRPKAWQVSWIVNGSFPTTLAFLSLISLRAFCGLYGISLVPFCPITNTFMAYVSFLISMMDTQKFHPSSRFCRKAVTLRQYQESFLTGSRYPFSWMRVLPVQKHGLGYCLVLNSLPWCSPSGPRLVILSQKGRLQAPCSVTCCRVVDISCLIHQCGFYLIFTFNINRIFTFFDLIIFKFPFIYINFISSNRWF